ncbi:MAG: hypothetical protein RL885_11940 [Planctomycetota bacterium]
MRHAILSGIVLLGLQALAISQTNPQAYHNGVEYFFSNAALLGGTPTNFTTATKSFGSATSIGGQSGGAETSVHPIGVQQDGFRAWNGQAGVTPSALQPIGFSLLEFRRGGTYSLNNGTVVATASWSTSLPCNAPWFWIVTFTWGTTFTQTATTLGAKQNFTFSVRGETQQSIGNQNYFAGSGNERNLNQSGLSFIEDNSLGFALHLPGNVELGHEYFQVDASSQANRDPSGASGTFGFDTASVGTGGTIFRTASSPRNPGAPADLFAIEHQAFQQLTGRVNSVFSLIAAPALGGGLAENASGSFSLIGLPNRRTNIVADSLLTAFGLKLPAFFQTGGGLQGLTGDVGLSGVAQTIPLDLSKVSLPPGLQPLKVVHQAVGVEIPFYSVITSADSFILD